MLYNDVRPLLAAKFNKEYGTKFTFDELNILALDDNVMPDTSAYNTMVTLEHVGYEPLTVFYNRGNFADSIPKGIDILLPDNSYNTVAKILPLVMYKYDLGLTPKDIVDAPVEYVNGYVNVVVKPDINFSNACILPIRILIGAVADDSKPIVDVTFKSRFGGLEARPDIFQKVFESKITSLHRYGSDSTIGHLLTAQTDYTPVAHILKNVVPYELYYSTIVLNSNAYGLLGLVLNAMSSVDGNDYRLLSHEVGVGLPNIYPAYNGPVDGLSGQFLKYTILAGENLDGVSADVGGLAAAVKLANREFTHVLIMETWVPNSATPSAYQAKPSFLICHYNLGK